MPDKQLTVATYAAGASLAAITLIYVFAPTYFIDSDSNSARKKGVVGLANPANDCFINSVLQALAGLTDLRIYLIRENHRRTIDEPWVYRELVPDPSRKNTPDWKLEGLQAGLVTKGLKEVLDQLNERPIYKKTISATAFVRVLEVAFRQRISRQQQDAQEFLQVVAERVCDEYHAGKRAREAARQKSRLEIAGSTSGGAVPVDAEAIEQRLAGLAVKGPESPNLDGQNSAVPMIQTDAGSPIEEEDGFPMEGKYESQIECQTCGFKPKPTESAFCTLTLNVPQTGGASSLNACLDGLFKTEYVDDFKCEKCRLVHARESYQNEYVRSKSESEKAKIKETIEKLQVAIDTDPEKPPEDVVLPDLQYAPKRKIARHTRLTALPKIMAIHLSRSIYGADHLSQKNSAKVAFPERLPLGGILAQKKYKLLGLVTHKGSHYSGHYESFRRQNTPSPYSTHNAFQQATVYTKSATPSPAATPQIRATPVLRSANDSPIASTPDLLSPDSPVPSSSNPSVEALSRPSVDTLSPGTPPLGPRPTPYKVAPTSAPRERDSDTVSLRSVAASARTTVSKISRSVRNSRPASPSHGGALANGLGRSSSNRVPNGTPVAPTIITNGTEPVKKRRRHGNDRWWRISDEKVKEAKTSEVLGMQREVYLLFYELEREERGGTEA